MYLKKISLGGQKIMYGKGLADWIQKNISFIVDYKSSAEINPAYSIHQETNEDQTLLEKRAKK